jgi:catalase
MPLSTDEKMLQLSREIIEAFDAANGGVHPGFRRRMRRAFSSRKLHAGVGSRVADARAARPAAVDAGHRALLGLRGHSGRRRRDPRGASPRGLAVRFHLGTHVHTDIVAHSVDAFPTRAAEEFLEFLHAVTDPHAIERFLATHPAALAFVQAPKPIPTSFARESFFAVSAFRFTDARGASRFGRYRILPLAGNEYLDDAGAAAKGADFLMDEIRQRVREKPVKFRVVVQLGEAGDVTDDATVRWPESRRQTAFGEITLDAVAADDAAEQQRIIFDPIPRVDGIDASADPLFEPRANVYLMSGDGVALRTARRARKSASARYTVCRGVRDGRRRRCEACARSARRRTIRRSRRARSLSCVCRRSPERWTSFQSRPSKRTSAIARRVACRAHPRQARLRPFERDGAHGFRSRIQRKLDRFCTCCVAPGLRGWRRPTGRPYRNAE